MHRSSVKIKTCRKTEWATKRRKGRISERGGRNFQQSRESVPGTRKPEAGLVMGQLPRWKNKKTKRKKSRGVKESFGQFEITPSENLAGIGTRTSNGGSCRGWRHWNWRWENRLRPSFHRIGKRIPTGGEKTTNVQGHKL